MAKQIKIRIYSDGNIMVETKNIKGKECLKYIAPMEQLLDAKVMDSTFTNDYQEVLVKADSEISETEVETIESK